MTVDYPPLPFTPRDVPVALYPVWWAATQLEDWLIDWHDGDLLTCYPPQLTTGHDVLCTARYDAEGDCHELAACVLLDDEEIPAARCTCRYLYFDHPAPGVPNAPWGHWAILINPYCWHHGDRWLG